jgi:hypothetical protein
MRFRSADRLLPYRPRLFIGARQKMPRASVHACSSDILALHQGVPLEARQFRAGQALLLNPFLPSFFARAGAQRTRQGPAPPDCRAKPRLLAMWHARDAGHHQPCDPIDYRRATSTRDACLQGEAPGEGRRPAPILCCNITRFWDIMAERQGFEPWERLRAQRFSRPPRSTAPASLRCGEGIGAVGGGRKGGRDGPQGQLTNSPGSDTRPRGWTYAREPSRRPRAGR